MRISDRLWALVFAVLGTAIIIEASSFPRLAGMSVGPGLFPIALSGALLVSAVLLLVSSFKDRGQPWLVWPRELREPAALWRISAVFGSCMLFAGLGKTLGFVIVGILALGWLLLAFGVRASRAVPIAVLMVVAIDLFLVRVMRIPLPTGVLTDFGGWL